MPFDLASEVAKHKWYHRIDLGNGIITPGWAPTDPDAYRIPADLTGKRVLDIGAWDGYWTFEALRRGAKQVIAIDDFSDTVGRSDVDRSSKWATFDLCRDALGYAPPQCQRYDGSLYEFDLMLANADVIFFFGTLYHCRYPLLALDRLASVCKPGGSIYIESAICDDYSPYQHGGHGDKMVMEFYPGSEYGANPSNWWVPTSRCLTAMVQAAGFDVVDAWKLENPTEIGLCRGWVHGVRR